jgi:hypothetical protein
VVFIGERGDGWAALALLALPAPAAPLPTAAQKDPKPYEPPPAVDPYTRGEAARLEQLGYRSFGPFPFGREPTDLVQARMGEVPVLWVETEHFRLGSALEEYEPELPQEVSELRAELAALRERLDSIPARAKTLDPWLRLHLFARRLEALHADVVARLGVAAGPPPADGTRPSRAQALTLGMRDKFTVLLTQKKSLLARFTREYLGTEQSENCIHAFHQQGTLFFGISDESVDMTDSDLHFAVLYGVTQNLLTAIGGFRRLPPPWWLHGLALWFARAAEPRVLLYSRPPGETLPPEELEDWEPLVRGRVEHAATLAWTDMLAREMWRGQAFGDNVVLWSRIDYLLRATSHARELVPILHAASGSVPDGATALQRIAGCDLETLDRRWAEWVRKNYRKKRR